ncbi:hypothetical protein V1264_000302 [Littorina saxatilis]
MSRSLLAAILCLLAKDGDGYGIYQNRIPNGDSVPSPCNPNVIWRGVGHLNAQGGGIRNKFGLDFAAAGHTWTRELCQKDSDEDGKTNGQELGDPDCTWTPNSLPPLDTGLSHPAVCEPIDSETCKSKAQEGGLYLKQEEWIADACKSGTFECPATNAADVERLTFQIPPTKVPNKVTSYMCQTFRVDDVSRDRHMIATRAIINNTNVMHHMVLFGCRDPNTPIFDVPYECGMSPGYSCGSILSVWTLGLDGECFYDLSGIRVGLNGLKVLAMQYHWNNPTQEDNYMDSSGMEMYFTPNLRDYDSGVAMFGQESILIPPYSTGTDVTGECTETCMNTMVKGQGINITYAFNHMHYLGVSQSVEQHRNGQFLRNITNDVVYNYDSPRTYQFEPPLEVLPGDRIVTKCHYKSPKRGITTFYGDETLDEMCYIFFTYYPFQNMPSPFCLAHDEWVYCDPATRKGCQQDDIGKFFTGFNNTELYQNITTRCEHFSPCITECKEAILTARASDPCLADPASWRILSNSLASSPDFNTFRAHLASCQVELYLEEHPTTSPATKSPSECECSSGATDNAATSTLPSGAETTSRAPDNAATSTLPSGAETTSRAPDNAATDNPTTTKSPSECECSSGATDNAATSTLPSGAETTSRAPDNAATDNPTSNCGAANNQATTKATCECDDSSGAVGNEANSLLAKFAVALICLVLLKG